MKFNASFFSCNFLLLCCCTFSVNTETTTTFKSNTQQGNSIDADLREEIRTKNEIILNAIYQNVPEQMYPIMSAELKKLKPDEFAAAIGQMHTMMDSTDHIVYNEYYTTSSDANVPINITSETGKDTNDFKISYASNSDTSYFSLLIYRIGPAEMMLSTLYGKYDHTWQLDAINLSNYAVYGQTGPEYYYQSKMKFESGELLAAYTLLLFSQLNNAPAGDIFNYELSDEMKKHQEKVFAKMEETYVFPIPLDKVPGKPELTGISIGGTSDYFYFPMVSYQTSINLTDAAAIEKEADLITLELEQVLPGFASLFSHVLLKAYNELPEKGKEVPVYTAVRPVVVPA